MLHAAQPGGAAGFIDWPLGMEGRYGDGSVLLAKQPWATQPATEEAGQFVARLFQAFRVHAAPVGCSRQLIHQSIEVVDQVAQTIDAASGQVRGVACGRRKSVAHRWCSLKFGKQIILGFCHLTTEAGENTIWASF